jgi:hypothetical protein
LFVLLEALQVDLQVYIGRVRGRVIVFPGREADFDVDDELPAVASTG